MPESGPGDVRHGSVLATRIVARGHEKEVLRRALDAARDGHGGVVFVVGEAGIGKSRLAAGAAGDAHGAGMVVLRGRAVPSPTPVPFRPLAEACCAYVREVGLPHVPELAPFEPTLGRLVPEWRAADTPLDDSVVMLAEAMLRFLRVVAGAPGCLLVLEDLHWADPETLTVVEYFADNVVAERVCVLGTLRDDEPTPAVALARSLDARRTATSLPLARLDDAAVEEMVASCLNVAAVPRDVLGLAARAEGVPFLVEEVLAATAASGGLINEGGRWSLATTVAPVVPITFADSVRRRVDLLGTDARAVLLAAATLGRRFDWTLLPAITALPETTVLAALHAAVDAHLVAADVQDAEFRFRHALTRDAVLAQLLPPERAALSRRALEVIERAHPTLPDAWCELAADLAYASDERGRAAELLLEVGRRALADGALASAEAALERARTIAVTDTEVVRDVEECLVEVLSLAGKRDRVFEIGASLLGRLPQRADHVRRAEISVWMARAAVTASDWSGARDALDQARVLADAAAEPALLARVDALAAHAALGAQDPERAVALARAALTQTEQSGPPEVACEALEILGRCDRVRDLDAAAAHFARAYSIAEQHGLTVWRVRALHELGTIDLLRNADTARLEEARRLATSVGAMATVAVLDVQLAASWTIRDNEDAVIATARRAMDVARRYHLERPLAAALAFEAHAHARRGRRAAMEQCLDECARHAGDDPSIATLALFGRALFEFVEEHRSDAISVLDDVAALSQGVGDQATGPSIGIWALAHVLAAPDAAAAEDVIDAAGHPVHFLALAYLQYARAVADGRAGRAEMAAQVAGAADAALADSPWFRQLARRLVAESAIRDGWGEPVPWLREAMAYFDARGNDRLASACRALLRRAGAPVPRRTAGSGEVPSGLRAMNVTGRELEVLQLLAEGRSNREIADRLHMSHRTVERHVANLTVKTGVAGRTELVAFAARTAAELPSA
jgi:DNA-binding CsgD family transcriptional regulator